MSRSRIKRIGITLGDPAGIGPEVTVKSISNASIRQLAQFTLVGDKKNFHKYSLLKSSKINLCDASAKANPAWKAGKPTAVSGAASLQYLKKGIALLKENSIDALVTAPVCKQAISKTYPNFQGHTELLAQAFGIKDAQMMFVSDHLKTVIATRHIPLKQVSKSLTPKIILQTILITHQALKNQFKIKNPRLAVCGLNPHAGEGGTIGKEELHAIIPAIQDAKKKKISIAGPLAADTLFHKDQSTTYDCIISMYHDQGLIPIKTLAFHTLVNLTIGLPFIRTSPAHGTAFDIAGQNRANPSSMMEAIKLAVKLS